MASANGFPRIFFFARAALVSAGKNIIFRYKNGYKQRLETFTHGLEFLNKAEKEKNNGKGNSASAPSRFASLSEGKMQFWQKDTLGKPNKLQTGLFHPLKASLIFFVLKLYIWDWSFQKKNWNQPILILFILLNISRYREQSLLILLSVFRVECYAQSHRLCYKTIVSCF